MLLAFVLTVIAIGTYLFTQRLLTVSYEVIIEPETLYASEGERAELRVVGISRSGGQVPWSDARCHVEVESGAGLITLEADADSSRWTLRATGAPGEVSLRVRSEHWPFPQLSVLRIETPTAQLTSTRLKSSQLTTAQPGTAQQPAGQLHMQ